MTTPPMPPTPARKIRLSDRGDEDEYLILSGDPELGSSITTARIRGDEIDIQGWYRSALYDGELVSDPERSIPLGEEAIRSLVTILPDLIRQLEDRRHQEFDEEQDHLALAAKTNAENGDA